MTAPEHVTYTLDLAATDFKLFTRLKSVFKGRRPRNATDIIKNATEELKILNRIASRNVSDIFTVADRNVYLHTGPYCRKCNLNDCTVFYFSNISTQVFAISTQVFLGFPVSISKC